LAGFQRKALTPPPAERQPDQQNPEEADGERDRRDLGTQRTLLTVYPAASSSEGYTPRSTSSKWLLTASLQRHDRPRSLFGSSTRIEPRRVCRMPSALKVWITRLV
jgi:hypothetical protein